MTKRLENYAKLAIKTGVNIQPGQTLLIQAKPEHVEFVRLLTKEAYDAGAKQVINKFSDDHLSRLHYLNQDLETLTHVPSWFIDEYDDYIDRGFVRLSVYAPSPGILNDVDSDKLSQAMRAMGMAMKRVREYSMANKGQWSLLSLPSKEWAAVVFPDLPIEEAYDKLFDAILMTSRVNEDEDPIATWKEHNAKLKHQNTVLNNYRFKSLHFKNGKGTDIVVGLTEDHIWCGGAETSASGYVFNPNIPTEESFTMPDRDNVNGRVYSTKPLNYSGKLIDEFWLEFKDGKVVDFGAEKEYETLKQLLDTDEGSRHLGEIALISYDSPISNMNIVFFNTLFDENASCHMALGASYPMNIKGGTEMSREELNARHANDSLNHEDFMFGSADMNIVGTTHDGQEVLIFEAGNFVI